MTRRRPRVARTRLVLDPSLDRLAYRCHPDGCPRGRTCCVGLAVEVSRREIRAIDSLMDELARLVPQLRTGEAYENVFVDDGAGAVIESRETGACPFLFQTRRHTLCAVHSVAATTGRPVTAFKPAACRHWPITLLAERGAIRVTVEPAALRIGCVAPARTLPGKPSVREAFREEIAEVCAAVGPASGTATSPRGTHRRPHGGGAG